MKSLIIPFSDNLESNYCIVNVNNFKWCNNNYKPDTKVYLAYNNDKIAFKFISFEKERVAKALLDDLPIYCDNCVEFFIKPFLDDKQYLNFEFNYMGFMTLEIGKSRKDRKPITNKYKKFLNVKPISSEEYWGIEFEIPFQILTEIYNHDNSFVKGYSFTGNFYKCADEFKLPHYGMWNSIPLSSPDFHVPEFFGNITLG